MPINKKKIVVLLAAFNGQAWIEEQLNSILKQSHAPIDIFISIDLSEDRTLSIIKRLNARNKNIHLLPYGKKFGNAAKNFFNLIKYIDIKNYEFFAFADQDDIWLPNKLERACEFLNNTKADAYSSNVIAFWPNQKQKLITKNQFYREWDYLFEAAGPGCTYVLTTKLMIHIQTCAKKYYKDIRLIELHDWFIYAFARSHNYKWVIDDFASVLYRQHKSNVMGANSGFKAIFQRLRKVLNGSWIHQIRLIAKFCTSKEINFINTYLYKNNERYFSLAFLFFKCRRKSSDQFVFFIIFIILGFKNFFTLKD